MSFAVPAPRAPRESQEQLKIRAQHLETRDMFLANYGLRLPVDDKSTQRKLALKIRAEYARVQHMEPPMPVKVPKQPKPAQQPSVQSVEISDVSLSDDIKAKARKTSSQSKSTAALIDDLPETTNQASRNGAGALVLHDGTKGASNSRALALGRSKRKMDKPEWRAPWKVSRVIQGHLGWVRSVAVDPANEWFVTGSADRTIKIWDLAAGTLKLTLTGHIGVIRGLCVSDRHPYMFSVGDDKMVRCWDLEYNKVIRSYHGHLSGVFACSLHPTLDVLVTGGRDSSARVWDVRTKAQVMILTGHEHTVCNIQTQAAEPQVITSSHDSTIRCWDLKTGKTMSNLTHHKKSPRAMCMHPTEYSWSSGGADNVKYWKCPRGEFMRNALDAPGGIINTMAVNQDGVQACGLDNGYMHFLDWKTGFKFQEIRAPPQPGSLDSESGIFACAFDQTGSRLITAEADKTVKIWKEDPTATEESHPINFNPHKYKRRKRF